MADNKIEQLQREKRELNALINSGYSFEVLIAESRLEKRMFGLIKRRKTVTEKRTFKIDEPTLSTLDRLSAEWVEFAIDEERLKGIDVMLRAKALVKHAKRLARIVAIAVNGTDHSEARIQTLTEIFFQSVRPSKLYEITVGINAMCNLGDFLNSIRLMQTERSAMPNLIEESNLV